MSVNWKEFTSMFNLIKNGEERLRVLAEIKEPSNREEYDSLCARILDTSNKLLEMTGDYTPDISTQEKKMQMETNEG